MRKNLVYDLKQRRSGFRAALKWSNTFLGICARFVYSGISFVKSSKSAIVCEAGMLQLVGIDEETIYREFTNLLDNQEAYEKMAHAANPYGDGHASERIADILEYGEIRH